MRISDWSSDVCSSDLYRYNLPILLLAASTLVLGACATRGAPAPVISLDPPAEVMTAATLTLPPAGPVEIVVIPEPLPLPGQQIGSASCRERVSQYGTISVVAVSLKKKNTRKTR